MLNCLFGDCLPIGSYIEDPVNLIYNKITGEDEERSFFSYKEEDPEGYDDWEMIHNILWNMGLAHLGRCIIGNPVRLGKKRYDGRNRPLKVEFSNESTVEMLLEAKYDLLNLDNYYRVYLNRDMTREEREAEIAERKKRNSRNFPDSASGAGDRRGGGGNGVKPKTRVNPSTTDGKPNVVNGSTHVTSWW